MRFQPRCGSGGLSASSPSISWIVSSSIWTRRWKWKLSPIWYPMVSTGFSDVDASWKIMEIASPRIDSMYASLRRTMSMPRLRSSARKKMTTLPSVILPGAWTMRIMDRTATLLPQPDSPTSP